MILFPFSFYGLYFMRYHHKPKNQTQQHYGVVYICDHPVYSRCTLYTIQTKGLSVIQQRYDQQTKHTFWTEIDAELQDEIFLDPNFLLYFRSRAKESDNGIYPTVTLRQLMWALRMKPLPKQKWETVFDRRDI